MSKCFLSCYYEVPVKHFVTIIMNLSSQVHVVYARYIMKCDDDTFVRLDSVIAEVKKIQNGESLYIGNMNYRHKPLRDGKWAVTYEVNLYLIPQ
jgi:hypothetical protein